MIEIIREYFSSHILFSIGILFFTGVLLGKLFERFRIPAIVGFLISGLLYGQSVLNFIQKDNVEILKMLSEIALCFLAIMIGAELSLPNLKKNRKTIFTLVLMQMAFSFIFVYAGMSLIGMGWFLSVMLGVISCTTAPSIIVFIISKTGIKGPIAEYLYSVVALSDAFTLMLFSIVFSYLSSILILKYADLMNIILVKSLHLMLSVLLGFIGGLIIHLSFIRLKNKKQILILALGIILLTTSIPLSMKISPLLTNMTIGFVFINITKKNYSQLMIFEPFSPVVYAIFFATAGAKLDLFELLRAEVLFAGAVYMLFRATGKYCGIHLAFTGNKMHSHMQKYFGIALIPQADVAIGLVLYAQTLPIMAFAQNSVLLEISKMANIILLSVFVTEIFLSPFVKLFAKRMSALDGIINH